MLLKTILLNNYRNYTKANLLCSPTLNIIWGNNAQGKSNLLEAIYLLSTGQAYRTNHDQELVRWGASYYLIKSEIQNNERTLDIELMYQIDQKKSLKINGYKRSRISDVLGVFNVVLFSPDDLYLVKGGPTRRRRYLDLTICRLNPSYYYYLQQYQKTVEQRNQLLRSLAITTSSLATLEVWDQQLVILGAKILGRRLQILPKLTKLSSYFYRKIASNTEQLFVRYQSTVNLPLENQEIDCSESTIARYFSDHLKHIRKEERKRGVTLIGPHRDDLVLYLDQHEMRNFGSQGQQRSAALSLKLAELEILANEQGDYPVLLLDDVLSELDSSRREFLFTQLLNKVQTFLTTTQYTYLNAEILKKASLIEVKNGVLWPT